MAEAKHAGGRPTTLTQDVIDAAQLYKDTWEHNPDEKIPSIAGLALHLGVARKTIYDWSKREEFPEFSDILESILSEQEVKLANNGLIGAFNPTITKMMMTKHGYSDKVEQDITSGGDKIQFTTIYESKPTDK